MATYSLANYFELFKTTLKLEDIVIFEIPDLGYVYEGHVGGNHINHPHYPNRDIFVKLGLKCEEAASLAYGYPSGGGDWPIARYDQKEQLTRAALYLWAECKKREQPRVFTLEELINPEVGHLPAFLAFTKKNGGKNNSEVMWKSASILMGVDLMPMKDKK